VFRPEQIVARHISHFEGEAAIGVAVGLSRYERQQVPAVLYSAFAFVQGVFRLDAIAIQRQADDRPVSVEVLGEVGDERTTGSE
jgi:hypothetical protein